MTLEYAETTAPRLTRKQSAQFLTARGFPISGAALKSCAVRAAPKVRASTFGSVGGLYTGPKTCLFGLKIALCPAANTKRADDVCRRHRPLVRQQPRLQRDRPSNSA